MNWTTFILEMLNFLVLVWILKRFLYRPVLEVIARRKAGIDKTLTEAKTLRTEAETLRAQYESRLADWQHERQQVREELAREIETERARRLAELQAGLEQEREKSRVAEERRRLDALHKMEETALVQGARFATYLLKEAAGPDLEVRLVELALAELSRLPAERIAALTNSYGKAPDGVVVLSAFPLTDELRRRLSQALQEVISPDIVPRFKHNSDLLAGVQITIGAWVLDANLREELKGFVELPHGT